MERMYEYVTADNADASIRVVQAFEREGFGARRNRVRPAPTEAQADLSQSAVRVVRVVCWFVRRPHLQQATVCSGRE